MELLSEREVREMVGVKRNEPTFPSPHQYGPGGRKWLDSDVRKWLEKRRRKRSCAVPKAKANL